ncbi:MAG: aconitate hydratase [Peptococcaceae bacterium]|nr:aconitate hydratase [Peptococcaceae bacterium]
MGLNLTQKILNSHLKSGKVGSGGEIGLKIDQTLTQDATGTMAYLQFEAMGIPKVKTDLSVSYIDHNTLQTGFENADDHAFLQSCASRFGVYFSRPGNGICHQVHLERFGKPGQTLLGSDSHTPTGGGIGMLAMGAGGLDVAVAMGGGEFYINDPKIVKVWLTGKLSPWVSAKDIILEMLRRLSVKGGVGKIFEYAGPGVATLSVPERATITNMGAELGATTSIFPSDEQTRLFLKAQNREQDYIPLQADPDATYDEEIIIDLASLEPLVAKPHMPDNVVAVTELLGTKVQQVAIGSCTNSSYRDLMAVAAILKGKVINPEVSLVIAPGSRQVLTMITNNGALTDLLDAGARILESTCGPCIGMGQSPSSGAVSLRTFNRNFKGRSGTIDAGIYLVSPEIAAASALTGTITDPRTLGAYPEIELPEYYRVDDSMILPPSDSEVEIVRGPNIKPLPVASKLSDTLKLPVVIKLDNNITTDDIMPAGAKILPLRSNIPAMSEYVFNKIDEDFSARAKSLGQSVIIAGHNYGQGSSREHAALVPMYLGIKVVVAKSFARIHKANLINFGILPLTFKREEDYDLITTDSKLIFEDMTQAIFSSEPLPVKIEGTNKTILLQHDFTDRQAKILLAGGLLNFTREANK